MEDAPGVVLGRLVVVWQPSTASANTPASAPTGGHLISCSPAEPSPLPGGQSPQPEGSSPRDRRRHHGLRARRPGCEPGETFGGDDTSASPKEGPDVLD